MTLQNNREANNTTPSNSLSKRPYLIRIERITLALLLQCASLNAIAACNLTPGDSPASLTISLPTTLPFPRDTPDNTVLYESGAVTAGGPSFNCTTDTKWGIKNKLGTDSPTSKLFPIGDTGISWQWLYNSSPISGDGGISSVSGEQFTPSTTRHMRFAS